MRGDLISADGTVASVIVFFDERRVDAVRAAVLDRIREIVTTRLPADFRVYYNGSIEISETYNRITLANQTKFTPPILALTLIALYAMFRSWRRTAAHAGAVMVSVIWTLGLYDLLGFNYNVLSSMIVPLVLVLAIADDVHIIQHYGEARRNGTAEEAFKSTVSHLVAPIFGASGTTALGMASLAMSNIVAVREFGLGSAIGVMVDFVISIVLMPTMLGWLRPENAPAPQETWLRKPMRWLASFTTRRARHGGCRFARDLRAGDRRPCRACASTRTTSTSSAGRIRSASRQTSSTIGCPGSTPFRCFSRVQPSRCGSPTCSPGWSGSRPSFASCRSCGR